MLAQGLGRPRQPGAESVFLGGPGLAPEWANVWVGELLKSIHEGERVTKRVPVDDFCGGHVAVGVWCVAQL